MRYLPLLIYFALPLILPAQEEGDWERYFSVVGRLNSILSKQFVVNNQENEGRQWIWANARFGEREYSTGGMKNSSNQLRGAMVPTDSGIVIVLHPPDPNPTSNPWLQWHDPATHSFQFSIPTGDKLKTRVMGSYGPSFPKETLVEILKLAGRELRYVPNQPK